MKNIDVKKHFTIEAYTVIQESKDTLLFKPYKFQSDMIRARKPGKYVAYNYFKHTR